MREPGSRRTLTRPAFAAYAAATAAFSFAGVSLCWALSGMTGVETLVPAIEQMARGRDPLLMTARGTAVLLIAYGMAQTTSMVLMLTGVVAPTARPGTFVLWWRALLWEPWFLVWGLLLLLASRGRTVSQRRAHHPRPAMT